VSLCFTRAPLKIRKAETVRQRAVVIFLLVLLCYVLGLVTAFDVPGELGTILTSVLQGKVRPFLVSRNFNETMAYVTDRKPGPLVDGNATYLGEYAAKTSYGLTTVQIPQHYPAGAPLETSAIKKVEPVSYPAFLKFLQDRSPKPLVIWIHGYRLSFPASTAYCAQIARDLDIDADVLTFDWASSESALAYARDVQQVSLSTRHLIDLLNTINNEVKPSKIIIIAHSLGCRLACLALQQLYENPNTRNLKLDHVVLLAPNVDREEFNQNFKSGLQALVKRLTIYVASDDNVLLLGKLLYNVDSIGLPEQFSPDTNLDEIQTFLYYEKQVPGKIDLVDVSFSKKDFLRKHRLFLERPVMEDLFWLIHDDRPAAQRHLLKYEGTHNPTDYYVIPP
jgi:esterase/lipase superfamily enzyme